MAGSFGSQSNPGAFVPTTNVWDVSQIYSTNVNAPEFKELIVRLYQNINNIALILNIKDSGYYVNQEFLNGQLFFQNINLFGTSGGPVYRQDFRMVINFGALPNTGTKSVPHNVEVTPAYTLTRLYAASTNTGATSFIPIPYSSPTLNQNITINADNVNINITTAIDYSAYTTTYVIMEYLKN